MAITKVTTEVITTSAVTTPKIADNAISAAKIPDGTIATGHIADNAVTAAKIPDNVLTATMLPDNVILATHIPNATNLTLGTVTANLTGDVTGNVTGTLQTAAQTNITSVGTIGTGVWQGTAIASGYIAADAITGAKIADDAIDSEHYTDGSIDAAHLAAAQTNITSLGTLTGLTGGTGDLIWDTTTLIVDSSANKVGIGIAPASGMLHLHAPADDNAYLHITQGDGGATSSDGMSIGMLDGGANAAIRLRENGFMQIYTNNTERMRIVAGGAVGIGTDTPTAGLTVATSANITQVALTSSSAAVAWDADAAANAYHVTTENTTFSAPSNATEGQIITLEIAQGGTARTIAWNTVFEFAASTAPTVTATASKTDIFSFRYNGSVWQEIGRVQNMAQT